MLKLVLAAALTLILPTTALADQLVSATIGLNYIGQGHCVVVNSGMEAADVTITIVQATSGAVLATTTATIPAGTSLTLPYQALTANFQDAYCEVTKGTPGAALRMVFKRVGFGGDVSEASDGLPTKAVGTNGSGSAPGAPGAKTIFVTSTTSAGNLGGLAGADAICQALADSSASIVPQGEYVALLSTGTPRVHGVSRLTPTGGPYFTPSGQLLARDLTHLFGIVDADPATYLIGGISENESGVPVNGSGFTESWTGSQSNGSASSVDCNAWTDGSSGTEGVVGTIVTVSGHLVQ